MFLGNMKRLLTTGVSRWNTRQIALWDQVSCREAEGLHKWVVALGGFARIWDSEVPSCLDIG